MKFIIVLKPSGHFEVLNYEDNYKIPLEEWQGLFGGANIECVPSVFPGTEILVDEEGKLKCLEENPIATLLMHPSMFDVLVGDAVICGVNGDNLDGMSKENMELVAGQIYAAKCLTKEGAENGL